MKRIAVWAFYGVGALAIGYLALYAYAVFSGRDLQPGAPIRIFRNPDAPSYSARDPVILTSLPATNAKRVRKGAEATKQSILPLRHDGLLRFARNDGESVSASPPPQSADSRRRRPA